MKGLTRNGIAIAIVLIGAAGCRMSKYEPGEQPALTEAEKSMAKAIEEDLEFLSKEVGERNAWNYERLCQSADWIEGQFKAMGYTVSRQGYELKRLPVMVNGKPDLKGKPFYNIEAELKGRGDGVVILGAHYDTVRGSPGADDNASGVAVMLEVARRMARDRCSRTVRFVAFVNEESPFFRSQDRGSRVYAKQCKEQGDRIEAMVSVDTVGYFKDQKRTQKYPIFLGNWFYPVRGNFLIFVGNRSSGGLTNLTTRIFLDKATINCEKFVCPNFMREGSDQASFWEMGYPAVVVTDTAIFRNKACHTPMDKIDRLNTENLGRVAEAMLEVMRRLAKSDRP